MDLDTMLSKIDSRIIDNMIVVKGPYSSRYGPGFDFVDVQLLDAPRFMDGFQSRGSSSVDYKTNGEQWYGRAFDSADLVHVFAAGEYEDGVPLNSTWADGDWDGSGDFNTTDLICAF